MHNVFQTHYHQDTSSRFPHIPSIPVSIPVDYRTQRDLCYTARYEYSQQPPTLSQEDVRNTAAALLHAVQELELDTDAHSIQQTNQESKGRPVRKYVIKRNYSGGNNSLCNCSAFFDVTWRCPQASGYKLDMFVSRSNSCVHAACEEPKCLRDAHQRCGFVISQIRVPLRSSMLHSLEVCSLRFG